MRIPRIYTDQPLQAGAEIDLGEQASHYLGRVLRLAIGHPIEVFNGCGGHYSAAIARIEKKSLWVVLGEFNNIERESPLAIHLGIGISRGERFDWVVQKATELGVASITPLMTERVEVRIKGDKADKKIRHWQQIAISACEQSQRNRVPIIGDVISLEQWYADIAADMKFVLHHRTEKRLGDYINPPNSIALLVGPEGGLNASEITAAQSAGFNPLALGPRVLRTETAPVTALAVLQAQWGDLK